MGNVKLIAPLQLIKKINDNVYELNFGQQKLNIDRHSALVFFNQFRHELNIGLIPFYL